MWRETGLQRKQDKVMKGLKFHAVEFGLSGEWSGEPVKGLEWRSASFRYVVIALCI